VGTTTTVNHLDPGQSKTGFSSSQIIFITLFSSQCNSFATHLTSLRNLRTYAGANPFSWCKLANFDFSSSDFNMQGHILSTGGDALIRTPKTTLVLTCKTLLKMRNWNAKIQKWRRTVFESLITKSERDKKKERKKKARYFYIWFSICSQNVEG